MGVVRRGVKNALLGGDCESRMRGWGAEGEAKRTRQYDFLFDEMMTEVHFRGVYTDNILTRHHYTLQRNLIVLVCLFKENMPILLYKVTQQKSKTPIHNQAQD